MNILNRSELIELFKSNELKIKDEDEAFASCAQNNYTKSGRFQQCSIDLRVGSIYVPETRPEDSGGAYNPKIDEHVLATGQTVMIRTKEKITLPEDIGGICFSPSRTALKAVLITNMGHVDPGYAGHLHFTAINMGKEPYCFRATDTICSMILFKLTSKQTPFGEEHFKKISQPGGLLSVPAVIANYFPKLSRDFVDVEKRAQKTAKDEILRATLYQYGMPLAIALLALLAATINSCSKPWEKDLVQLKEQMSSIESKFEYNSRLTATEDQLKDFLQQQEQHEQHEQQK